MPSSGFCRGPVSDPVPGLVVLAVSPLRVYTRAYPGLWAPETSVPLPAL